VSFDRLKYAPRVNEPNTRNNKGVHEEHNRLLLNNTIVVLINIMVGDILHEQSHDSRGEK
jgi:hypothetical protein